MGYTNVIDPGARTITRAATPTQVTLPGGKVVPLFGGYVPQATAHGSIPKLLIPKSGSGEAISADVIESLARTGEYHGIIGGTEVTFTPSRLGQAYQAANEGTALYFSSTPMGKVVAAGPKAMAKPGKGYAEQYFFLEAGDATDKFMGRAAFGATGQDPAIMVYAEADGPITRVVEADGSVKYYQNGFEMEKGIRSRGQIPPAERVAAGGIRSGNVYESSSVVAPSFRQRLEANVKAIGDLFTAREAGKFSYTSPGDLDAFRVDPTKGDLTPAVREHIANRIEADQQAAGAAFDAEVASGSATPEMRQARLSEAYDGTIDAIAEEQGLISRAIDAQAEIDAMARTARTEAERIAVSEARARLAEGGARYTGARLGPPRVPGEIPGFRTPPPPEDETDLRTPPGVPDLRTPPPPPEDVPDLRTPPPPEDVPDTPFRLSRLRLKQPDPVQVHPDDPDKGPYPRLIRHVETEDVITDLDTGLSTVQLKETESSPQVVQWDNTPPVYQTRFSGNQRIVADGTTLKAAPVKTRHKNVHKRPHPYQRLRRAIRRSQGARS